MEPQTVSATEENGGAHDDSPAVSAPPQAVSGGEGEGIALPDRFVLAPLEYGGLLILFLGVTIFGALYAAGPIFYDEVRYMEMAMNPALIAGYESQFLRLFHVYILKLFLLIAEPVQAARLFWAVVVALTSVLVYVNARLLTRTTTYVHGILAVYLFFSTTVVFQWSGSALTDLTLMLLVTLGITCYLLSHRLSRYRFIPLMGLGLMLFLAIQSKQIGIGLAVVLPGLGWVGGNTFQWRKLAMHNALVVAGVAVGVVLLALLNAVFVGDAFFGINRRLQEFWFVFNRIFVGEGVLPGVLPGLALGPLVSMLLDGQSDLWAFALAQGGPIRFAPLLVTKQFLGNWYTSTMYEGQWMVVFVLYLLAILKAPPQRFKVVERFVWLIPLAVLILFSLASSYMNFLGTRHYLLMFPVLSVLAAQCMTIEPEELAGHHGKILGGAAATLLVGALVLPSLEIPQFELGFNALIYRLVYPLGLAVVFIASVVPWKQKHWPNLVIAFVVVFISAPAIASIPNLVTRGRQLHEAIFYPYTRFSDELGYSEDMHLLFSPTITEDQPVLAIDDNVARGLFKMALNQPAPAMYGQFTVTYPIDFDTIAENAYTDVLLSIRDWESLSEAQQQAIADRYTVQFDTQDASDSEIVLLSLSS